MKTTKRPRRYVNRGEWDGCGRVSWMRWPPDVGRTVRSVVVPEGAAILPARPNAGHDGARPGPHHGDVARPVPDDGELLSNPKEGPRPHEPVLDRGPDWEPAGLHEAKDAPPQGGHPDLRGREHDAGTVPDPAATDPRYLGHVRRGRFRVECVVGIHPAEGPHLDVRRGRVGDSGPS